MKFLNPEAVLREFGLYGTQDAADIGSGSGHFSLAAAKRLDGGRLFAVDIEREMLKRLVDDAKAAGHTNVFAVWGDAARMRGIPLADESLDRVIATNVLFQIDDRDVFVQEIKRILKPGGKVLVVDWQEGSTFGPHKHHQVSAELAHGLFRRHGFTKEKDVDAGDHHYGMILIR